MSNKLLAANEIVGAVASHNLQNVDIESFKADPKAFAFQKGNIDFGNINLSVVENSDNTMHLALPYYSSLDNIDSAMLADENMDDIAGGEVFGSLGIIIASVIAGTAIGVGTAGAAVTGITVGAIAGENAQRGENIDGSAK